MGHTRALRKFIRSEIGRSLHLATVRAVNGDTVNVQVGGSPRYLRGLPVIGGVENVVVGDTVLLRRADGQVYAESTRAKAGQRYGNKSGAAVAGVMGWHSHLSSAQGGVLESYVRVDDVDTITAQHSFSPTSPSAPFLLGSNAQHQVVTGFRADELSKSVVAGTGLTGGGVLTANRTLAVDLAHEFAWTADHSWDGDTLYVDVSEDAVYINSGTLPTIRGALTVKPGANSQRGFVLKRPCYAMGYDPDLMAIIDENDDLLVRMTKRGDLESGNPAFVSGQTGWQMTFDGNLECNNAFIRGELHASVFVADEMHATGGTLAVMTASKVAEPKVTTDNKLLGVVGDPMVLVVQASWDTGLCYVADNHVLRIKSMAEIAAGGSLDLWDIWLEVIGAPVTNSDRNLADGKPGTYDVPCTWRQGGEANLVIPTGAAAIHWGTIGTKKGGLILTSDLNYSPYMDIFTIPATTPWSSGTTPHVRVGNLDGVLGLGEEWGIAAGGDLSNTAKPHIVMSGERVRLWGVAQRWWDTSGNVRGEVDPSAGPTGVLFWLGPSEAGARFKVLGSGDVWLDTLAISGDLGDFLFSKTDGLLLLGPNCEISDSGWWSLRRQKATITGAFHQEAGRWMGTRGLVVERETTNLETNPSMETGDPPTGYNEYYGDYVVLSRQEEPLFGDYSARCVCIADPTNTGMLDDITVTHGLGYTFSVWVKAPAGTVMQVAATRALSDSEVFAATGYWQRISVGGVADTTTYSYARLYVVRTDNEAVTFYVDGWQLEQKVCATTYCDGDQGHEYTWTGTAHASTSTRAATEVNLDAHAAILSGKDTFSVRVVLQAPYDYNATWPDLYHYLFMAYEDASNQVYIRYAISAGIWQAVFIQGGVTKVSSAAPTPFSKGDWIDMVANFNTGGEIELFENGLLIDHEDMSALSNITPTQMNLGAQYTATRRWGGVIVEHALLNRVLTATEVAAVHALQRPMVDAGSLDLPGIYILDGRFRMASSLTGNRIEMTAEEIAGYDSGGTKQFYLRASDGVALAAGGKWLVDASGQRIRVGTSEQDPRAIRWIYDDANDDQVTSVGACWESTYIVESKTNAHLWLRAYRRVGDAWADAAITLDVTDYVDSKNAYMDLYASLRVISMSDNLFLGVNTFPVDAGDIRGARGIVSLRNIHTLPSGNPTWGGFLYAQGGAGKWRGSGGTITTFGPAEPHCPVCGRDFVLEWENEEWGSHLQVCMWCLAEALRGEKGFILKQTGPARVTRHETLPPSPPMRVDRYRRQIELEEASKPS